MFQPIARDLCQCVVSFTRNRLRVSQSIHLGTEIVMFTEPKEFYRFVTFVR